jgi:hypothetical protein
MPLNSLYLGPADPDTAPPTGPVVDVLRDLAVIGEPLGDSTYLAGPGFTRHIVFAGCSPHLVLTPPQDGGLAFSHVALHGPFDSSRLVTGALSVKPRCPHCRTRIADWRERIAEPTSLGEWHCPGCGRPVQPCALDWRQHALCGRLLIELRNVFPGEAAPSDTLLRELRLATGSDWRFAWAGCLAAANADDQPTTT